MAWYECQLPHWQPEDAWLFVAWRLAGSLRAIQTSDSRAVVSARKAFVSLDRMLDRAVGGPVWLKDPRVASVVCEVIRQAESPRRLCRLGGYVVMSNHVHLLALPLESAARLTH
jgi:hypothetical protein